jgi:hypothetical protein
MAEPKPAFSSVFANFAQEPDWTELQQHSPWNVEFGRATRSFTHFVEAVTFHASTLTEVLAKGVSTPIMNEVVNEV